MNIHHQQSHSLFFSETEIGKTLSLYQKETGNKVIIKDCSLGKGIPAIGFL